MNTTILSILLYNMCKNTINSVLELISSHCDVFDSSSLPSAMSLPGAVHFQVDFLRFYVPPEKWMLYGTPRNDGVKDNPNYEPTEYHNVYKLTDHKYSIYDYIIPNVAPVSILRWEKVTLKKDGKVQELIQVCVYGKGLKLYYSGHVSRLKDFIIRYGGECTRVDLCWDFKHKLPGDKYQGDLRTDLAPSGMYLSPDGKDIDTIYYGKNKSPFLIRIYNKTQDLRHSKNIHSFLYPSRYMKECWRYEIELKGNYAKSNTPIDWLEIQSRDLKIQTVPQTKRNNAKTLIYCAINNINEINYDDSERLLILQSAKELLNNQIKRLLRNPK